MKQRLQVVKIGSNNCSFRSRIIHNESIWRMHGDFTLNSGNWYDTQKYGTHLNKLTGFSTDFYGKDRVRLAWRPSPRPRFFEIYAYLTIGGRHMQPQKLFNDQISVVRGDEKHSFDLRHYIPEMETPEETTNHARQAMFMVDGRCLSRSFPVTPGLAGWIQNFYFGGTPKAPWDMFNILNYELNTIEE